MAALIDGFQRNISYLRISITDRCNLRCIYCMPPEGIPLVSHNEILSFEEILLIVRSAVDLGIDKIRITGGEPLVRSGIVNLIQMIASVRGIKDISMTTNGILLAQHAQDLADAGLNRINISLDTLKYDRFKKITRMGELSDALKGIEAAKQSGLNPVKINMVPMLGINDDEIGDFAIMSMEAGWHVRFIELMPVNRNAEFVPTHVLREKIECLGKLEPYVGITGNGSAQYYRFAGSKGSIGFISPVSEPFCETCNRLRLSATGFLYPCLFSDNGSNLKLALKDGANSDKLKELITSSIASKPKMHCFSSADVDNIKMSQIGG
jgi:GTP 3',8-cyclase